MSPNILMVRFSSIGDLILTTPLIRALRNRHPEAKITFVLRQDMADTLRHNPRIDELVLWDHGTPLTDLAKRLRGQAWTHRLDLHCSTRSSLLRMMIPGRWNRYPKHRLKRALIIRSGRKLGGSLAPTAERYFEAASGLDVTPDGEAPEFYTSARDEAAVGEFLVRHSLGRSRRLVAIAPGAAHATKRWPARHWHDLVQLLAGQNDIVILGGPTDRDLGMDLAASLDTGIANAAGGFSLLGSGALLRRADLLISGDTGLMHMATAVGTKALALFGPGVEEFGFFPYRSPHRVLQLDLPCRPCTPHGGPSCPLGHHDCLEKITPESVFRAASGPIR